MKRFILTCLLLTTFPLISIAQLQYPKPEKGTVVDDYFGTKVADPYRWMEDVDSSKTKAWVEQENKLTFAYLDKIPFRNKIKKEILLAFDIAFHLSFY